MRQSFPFVYGALGFALTGCAAATPIANLGNDTYAVTVAAEGDTTPWTLRQRAVDISQDQCTTQVRYFYIVSETTGVTPAGKRNLTMTFRCLSGDDPLLRQPDRLKTN